MSVRTLAPARDPHSRRSAGKSWPTPESCALVSFVAIGIVVRLWDLGSRPLSLDESFEALTARRSILDLARFLAHHDTAPPLTYLIRAPFIAVSATNTMARLPSALCSIAALVLFAFWMRRRGLLGVVATALVAISGFQIHYGREARMYALLQLVGVAAAVVCDAWLRAPRRAHLIVVALVGLAAVFTHAEGFFLVAGLFTLAGVRRDQASWMWRAAVATPVLLYAVAWGWALPSQMAHDHEPGMNTSVSAVLDVVGDVVTSQTALRGLAAIATAIGGAMLIARHRRLGRTWLACFAIPLALACVAGLRLDLLLPRFFAYAAWAPLLALAALVEAAAARRALLGVAAVVVAVALVLPAGVDSANYRGPAAVAVLELRRSTAPGDRIAVRPAWLGYLLQWNLGQRAPLLAEADDSPLVPGTYSMVVPGGPETGRVWLLEPHDIGLRPPDGTPCSAGWTDGISTIRCYEVSRR